MKKESKKNVQLIAAMAAKEVTNNELAERIGCSVTALSMLRRGQCGCRVRTALKIARELGFTVEDLFGAMIADEEG